MDKQLVVFLTGTAFGSCLKTLVLFTFDWGIDPNWNSCGVGKDHNELLRGIGRN